MLWVTHCTFPVSATSYFHSAAVQRQILCFYRNGFKRQLKLLIALRMKLKTMYDERMKYPKLLFSTLNSPTFDRTMTITVTFISSLVSQKTLSMTNWCLRCFTCYQSTFSASRFSFNTLKWSFAHLILGANVMEKKRIVKWCSVKSERVCVRRRVELMDGSTHTGPRPRRLMPTSQSVDLFQLCMLTYEMCLTFVVCWWRLPPWTSSFPDHPKLIWNCGWS